MYHHTVSLFSSCWMIDYEFHTYWMCARILNTWWLFIEQMLNMICLTNWIIFTHMYVWIYSNGERIQTRLNVSKNLAPGRYIENRCRSIMFNICWIRWMFEYSHTLLHAEHVVNPMNDTESLCCEDQRISQYVWIVEYVFTHCWMFELRHYSICLLKLACG